MDKIIKITDAKKRGIFINFTRNKSRKEIRRIEEKKGKHLSKQAKIKIIKRNARRAKVYTAIVITSFLLGGVANNQVTNLLESGKPEISIDADQPNNGTNVRQEFLNGLQVQSTQTAKNEELEQGVIAEINNLKNLDEVLNYIKQIYLNEYNQRNGEEATINDIKLHKDRTAHLYKDVAQNGDEIIRKGISKTNQSVDSKIGLLSVLVQDGNESYMEDVIYDGKEYKNVYGKDEVVSQDEESILQDVGAIVEHGIDYYSGFTDEKESEIYKQRLIDAVTQYKYSKVKEIIEPSTTQEIDNQIDDELGLS